MNYKKKYGYKRKGCHFNDLKEENKGWADKVSRLMSQEADVPSKDIVPTLEAKIKNLVLENDALNSKLLALSLELKGLQITEKGNMISGISVRTPKF